ncbi:MAG: DUF3810 domain-containing protein [Corallococcus sp.]|nr:DUF3810 domain-containing protein [Corallococcus sp.]MCM1359446.1 DUF3810 domain-containing protein [Corallococcus sp.]MCM1394742.1 DUF3810 domain-containing protein [Corallococcus sp.]
MKKSTAKKLIVLGALFLVLGILLILKNSQNVCEFFATTFSRAWIFLFGNLFGWLPFSLYELLLICAIIGAVIFIVFAIIHIAKRKWRSLISLTLAVAIGIVSFVNVYTVTASFSYNRKPLPAEIYSEYTEKDFSFEQAVALADNLVQKANAAYAQTKRDEKGNIVYPFNFSELSDLLADEYKRLDSDYFSSYTPKGKRILNKWVMSQMHITGVFFAPFGEANVNGNENNLFLPCTLAHEMAHGKGVMREYQADLVAYYVLLTSGNPYLQYGAFVDVLFSALSLVRMYPNSTDIYKQLYDKIDRGIFTEIKNYNEFYSQFTLFDDIGKFFNDLYLKLQGQKDGTDSYVKPPQTEDTGEKDDFGEEIVTIINFSGEQNLLIHLFKQGLL